MNKILVLQIQDRELYCNVKCIFTFDKLLYKNAKFNSRWISELTNTILYLEVFKLEDYNKYIETIELDNLNDKYNGNDIVYTIPKSQQLFLDSYQTLYTFNDYKCVEHQKYFHVHYKKCIIPIDLNRINYDIYENGIYIFDECIEKNKLTVGAIQYLKELKSKEYTEPLDVLIWLHNLTDTLKTLIRWYY